MDRKSQRLAGRAAMAGHFEDVDKVIETIKALSGAQSNAALKVLAYDFPQEVLSAIEEVRSESDVEPPHWARSLKSL